MRTIEHTVDIQAPAATVWQIVTDTDHYDEWNPFMPRLSGRFALGERLTLTVRPGKRRMTFRPTVIAFEEGTLIRWRGRLPGFFDGEHELRLKPGFDGGTHFVQRETFTGLLVPMLPHVLDDTATGFAAMNVALRDRAQFRIASADEPVGLLPAQLIPRMPPAGPSSAEPAPVSARPPLVLGSTSKGTHHDH
jgi:hypothetical protein